MCVLLYYCTCYLENSRVCVFFMQPKTSHTHTTHTYIVVCSTGYSTARSPKYFSICFAQKASSHTALFCTCIYACIWPQNVIKLIYLESVGIPSIFFCIHKIRFTIFVVFFFIIIILLVASWPLWHITSTHIHYIIRARLSNDDRERERKKHNSKHTMHVWRVREWDGRDTIVSMYALRFWDCVIVSSLLVADASP